MPNTKQHLEQVRHNRELLDTLDLDKTPYLDWVITIAFYTALHLVEAWFADLLRPQHFESHKMRQDEMARVTEFQPTVYRMYRFLEEHSRNTRYSCFYPSKGFVKDKILSKLDILEAEIQKLRAS